jgi:integral membrane sensor domain MASE1
VASTVWLPAGAGIAFLYLGGLRFWPGVLIGDLLVNDYSTLPVGTALAQTIGNVLECVVAALLLHRLVRTRSPLDTLDGLARGLCALAAGVAVSATVGVAASWIGEVISFDATPHIWRTWFLGDISGALIVVPLAVAWSELPSLRLDRRRWIEGAVVVGILAGATEAAFRATHPLVYLVFPALVWSAVRFGKRGATLALVISSALAVWNVTRYDGAVHLPLDLAQRPRNAAVHRRRRGHDPLPRRRGRRAGAAGRPPGCVADRDARRRRDRAAPGRA